MITKIKNHIIERKAINEELSNIIKHLDLNENAPFEIFEGDWVLDGDSLHIQHSDDDIKEDYYPYTVSSSGAKGKELYIGDINGFTYIMGYPEDGSWYDTKIYVLDNKNRVKS